MRLTIEVPPEVAAANPQVQRDGMAVPRSLWGLPTPVDPGLHVIEVTAPGKRAQRIEVSPSTPGSTTKLAISPLSDDPSALAAPAPAAAPLPAQAGTGLGLQPTNLTPGPQPPAPVADRSGLRLTGFVLGGLGVVAAATGTVFLVLGNKENDRALSMCTGGPDGNLCATSVESRNHETHRRAARDNFTIGYVGLGLGGAGLTSAIILVALGSGGSSASAADAARSRQWALAPRVSDADLGLDFSARF
jgi:hypothetical protein